ncbi:MAG: LrgB family protein, partial [Campylobacteraceae bacterium]|nr:LrgB family protein [Campylobacteraceae bacterium]
MMLFDYPLIMLLLTLSLFALSEIIFKKSAKHPLLHPFLVTIILIIAVLHTFDISYSEYRDGTSILNALIAPAIVSLAVPLYQNLKQVKS